MFRRISVFAAALCIAPAAAQEAPQPKLSELERLGIRLEQSWERFLKRHSWLKVAEQRYQYEMLGHSFAGMRMDGGSDGQFVLKHLEFPPAHLTDDKYELHYSRTPRGLGAWVGADWQEYRAPEIRPLAGVAYSWNDSYLSFDNRGKFTLMHNHMIFETNGRSAALGYQLRF